MRRIRQIGPLNHVVSTDAQEDQALADTRSILERCKKLCLELDIGLSALPTVVHLFDHRLNAIVCAAEARRAEARASLIASIQENAPDVTPIRGRRRGIVDDDMDAELQLFNMTDDELRAKARELGIATDF